MSTFIERFKEFGKMNEKDDSDLKTITELLEKLSGKTYEDIKQNILELEDQKNTANPQESLATNQKKIQKSKVLLSIENAITAVLALARKNESVEKWKNNTVFKLESLQKNQNSEYYMNLLTNNFDVTYSLVGQFEKHFLDEIDKIKFINGGTEVFFSNEC